MALVTIMILGAAAFAQVSPAEILNPQLKALEQTYLPQLEALNGAVSSAEFPFTFYLSRYVGLDPKQQAGTDTRGVEFVKFHDRVVLKITGNYNAAYSANTLTGNERASQTFQNVIVPIIHLVIKTIPPSITCDAIGFEISYHARTRSKSYDYEGKEILVVVLDKSDAFSFFDSPPDSERQDILDHSEVYLNGKEYGLQLGQRDPASVEALARPASHPPVQVPTASATASPAKESGADVRLPALGRDRPVGSSPARNAEQCCGEVRRSCRLRVRLQARYRE